MYQGRRTGAAVPTTTNEWASSSRKHRLAALELEQLLTKARRMECPVRGITLYLDMVYQYESFSETSEVHTKKQGTELDEEAKRRAKKAKSTANVKSQVNPAATEAHTESGIRDSPVLNVQQLQQVEEFVRFGGLGFS